MIYVKINYPVSIRKKLLKSAIECIQLDKFYEHYKEISEKKRSYFVELKKIKASVVRDVNKLVKLVPYVEKPKEIKAIKEEEKKIKDELKYIEEKLKNL